MYAEIFGEPQIKLRDFYIQFNVRKLSFVFSETKYIVRACNGRYQSLLADWTCGLTTSTEYVQSNCASNSTRISLSLSTASVNKRILSRFSYTVMLKLHHFYFNYLLILVFLFFFFRSKCFTISSILLLLLLRVMENCTYVFTLFLSP